MPKRNAFTWVELLVVIAIIGILLALLVPFMRMAREDARRCQCVCHCKGIGLAFLNYHDVHGCLPPVYTVDENDKPLHSWRVLILPFLEKNELYKKIRLNEPWDSPYNRQFHDVIVSHFSCPSGPAASCAYKKFPHMKQGNCYYSVIVGPDTPFPGAESTKLSDCTDGLSKTLLVVERMTPICWMDPNNEISFDTACEGVNRNLFGIGSTHPGGTNCAFMDDSCIFLREGLDLKPFLTKSARDDADTKVFWQSR